MTLFLTTNQLNNQERVAPVYEFDVFNINSLIQCCEFHKKL